MIDPVDTEREPTNDAPEARVFPNTAVPIGSSVTGPAGGVGLPPAIAVTGDPEDAANRVSDETDEPWSYKTQAEVGAGHDFGPGTDEVPPEAGALAAQESDAAALNTEYVS